MSMVYSTTPTSTWADLWQALNEELRIRHYQLSTRSLYRQVIRDLAATATCTPKELTPHHITHHISCLIHRQVGADWTAQQISVLRVCFDHILQRGLLKHIRAPRKPRRLPTVLNRAEIRDLIASTRDLRSYLILALLYGCGLKPGELRLLTWDMLQASRGRLCLPAVGHSPARTIPLPRKLRGLLRKGKESGVHGSDYIFPGRMRTDPLSQRVIEHTVRQHTKAAGIRKPVTAMILRHSYAVHQLETGMNLRQIQLALGPRGLHAALRYAACVPPNYSPPEPDAQRSPPASSIPAPPEAPLFPLTSPRGKIRSWLSGLQLPWRPRPTGPPGI